LRNAGHITVSFTYVPGKKEIQNRLLRLAEAEPSQIARQEKEQPASEFANSEEPPAEVGKKFATRGEKNCHTYGKNLPQVGKISSAGGEKICRDNTTNNTTNNNTTTTTAPGPRESDPKQPPAAEKTAAVAASPFSPTDLKEALSAVDKRLSFDKSFYPKAAALLSENGLDFGYLSWLHNHCENMDYRSFDWLYFSLFFKDNMIEKYKLSLSESLPIPSKPPPPVECPACGLERREQNGCCPSCGLPEKPTPEMVMLYRELHEFPPEKRGEYLRREESLYCDYITKPSELDKFQTLLAGLKQEFGLTASP
jgi:hypothetical protein